MLVSNPGLRGYLESKLKTTLTADAIFLGRLKDDGSIWGVVGYDNFSQWDCEIFMAGEPGWVSMSFMKATFAYPFTQLGLERVTGRIDANDKKALDIDMRFGFKVEGRLRNALGNRDIIIVGMLRHECKWIQHGQEKHTENT